MSQLHDFSDTGELCTLRDWLRFSVSAFNEAELSFGHGSTNAYDEAAYLILHTLNLPLDTLDPFLDARLVAGEKRALLELLKKRVGKRVPVAYLTHEAWLGEYRFYVDERVIVPRSFIAELLREQLEPWIAEPGKVMRVLDLCTGSGCLAILAAHAFPNASVDAADISTDALHVAQRNVEAYELTDRIRLVHSDLFAGLKDGKYDLIVSNPPYVDAAAMAALPPEYLHEPRLALGSGEDGLDATRKILGQAARHLNPKGVLVVEIGHQRAVLESAFETLPFTWLNGSAGNDHVFLLHREELV